MTEFRFREYILRHMHIHFISVEVRIIGFGYTDVNPECITHLHHFYYMTHHRDAM